MHKMAQQQRRQLVTFAIFQSIECDKVLIFHDPNEPRCRPIDHLYCVNANAIGLHISTKTQADYANNNNYTQ